MKTKIINYKKKRVPRSIWKHCKTLTMPDSIFPATITEEHKGWAAFIIVVNGEVRSISRNNADIRNEYVNLPNFKPSDNFTLYVTLYYKKPSAETSCYKEALKCSELNSGTAKMSTLLLKQNFERGVKLDFIVRRLPGELNQATALRYLKLNTDCDIVRYKSVMNNEDIEDFYNNAIDRTKSNPEIIGVSITPVAHAGYLLSGRVKKEDVCFFFPVTKKADSIITVTDINVVMNSKGTLVVNIKYTPKGTKLTISEKYISVWLFNRDAPMVNAEMVEKRSAYKLESLTHIDNSDDFIPLLNCPYCGSKITNKSKCSSLDECPEYMKRCILRIFNTRNVINLKSLKDKIQDLKDDITKYKDPADFFTKVGLTAITELRKARLTDSFVNRCKRIIMFKSAFLYGFPNLNSHKDTKHSFLVSDLKNTIQNCNTLSDLILSLSTWKHKELLADWVIPTLHIFNNY